MTDRDSLERQCIEPGLWLVEGFQVRRTGRGRWLVVGLPNGTASSFHEALGLIVDAIENV